MGKFLHDVLELPERSQKPRKSGLTILIVPPSSEGVPAPVKALADYVDKVKFTVQCLWVEEDLMARNIKEYRDLGIDVQIGGVPYELAIVQGKQRQFLEKMKSLGVNMIEVESHAVGLSLDTMKAEVSRLKEIGFQVVGEVGAKWVEKDETREVQDRVLVDRVIHKMRALLDAGADYVYWEGMVVRSLIGNQLENKAGQKQLLEVAKTIGPERILFEIWDARSGGNSQLWGWLVNQFGPDVNIGNVAVTEIGRLECARRGCIYDPAHPYLRWLSEGRPTTAWWRIPSPDYSVDIQVPPVWRHTAVDKA
jgi:phosphosulfolactate synthase